MDYCGPRFASLAVAMRILLKLARYLLPGIIGGVLVYTLWGGTYGPAIRDWVAASFRYREANRLYEAGRESYLKFSMDGFRDSENYYRAALDRRPGYAKAHAGLAELYAASASMAAYRGESFRALSERALTESLTAIALEPGLFESHKSLGAALVQAGERTLALQEEDRALAIKPGDHEARLWKWVAEGRKYDRVYFKSIEDDTSYDFLLGLISVGFRLSVQGSSEDARRFFRKSESLAQKRGEDLALIHLGMANTYLNDAGPAQMPSHAEMIGKAISEFSRAADLDDRLAIAHSNLGNAYFAQKSWPDALRHFEHALRVDSKYQIAMYNKAMALYENKQDQQALSAWKNTEELSTLSTAPQPMALGKLSEAFRFYVKGQIAQAVDAYRQAVDAGKRDEPPMDLDSPDWCLTRQVVGPRGVNVLRALIKLGGIRAH